MLKLTATALSLFALVACSAEVSVKPATGGVAFAADGLAVDGGCAQHVFHMDGAEGCELAVKLPAMDKPFMVTGSEFDIMAVGGCQAAQKLVVSGEVDGTNFAATSVKLSE